MHLRILAISHCDIAVSHLISSSLLPLVPVSSHPNSTTSSFLTRGSRLVSSRLLVISRSQRPRAVLSFRKVKTNTRPLHPIRAARASSTRRPNQTLRLITTGIRCELSLDRESLRLSKTSGIHFSTF